MDKPPALSPFRTVDGVSVPEAASLREGFQAHRDDRGYSRILLNVSADRIALVFRWLVERIPGPGYFVLETGTHEVEERKLRKTATDPFHCDVWHLDGLQSADMLAILGDYERLLVHDGMVRFGYGAHGCVDEVFVGPYKLFHMYAADAPPRYCPAPRPRVPRSLHTSHSLGHLYE